MRENNSIPQEQDERLRQAQRNLEDIQKRIAPFIKRQTIGTRLPGGQWKKAPDPAEKRVLTKQDFFSSLTRASRPFPDLADEEQDET